MRKIRKEDWLTAGLALLEEGGAARLTIDALAARLKLTKGSFYHHFGNFDGYTAALMQYWLEESSLKFIRLAERKKNIGRPAFLASLAKEAGQAAERAVRGWAAGNPVVKLYLQQLDGIRLKYLEKMLLDQGMDDGAALKVARLEYAQMIGLVQLYPELSSEELRGIYELRT